LLIYFLKKRKERENNIKNEKCYQTKQLLL